MSPALTKALAALATRLTASGDYEAVDVIDTATARIARLEEALGPMLRGIKEADYYCPDDVAEEHVVLISVTIAELREARAALGSDAG